MLQALKMVQEEADETSGDINSLIGSLEQYNLVETPQSYQELRNNKGNGKGYSRV